MDEEERTGKISEAEGILGCFFFAGADLVGLGLVVFGIDDFGILEILTSPVFLYLYLKGVTPMYQAAGVVGEVIPYAGSLVPAYSIGWLATWWVDAHPEGAAEKAVATAAVVASVKGGRGAPRAGAPAGGAAGAAGRGAQIAARAAVQEAAAVEQGTTAAPAVRPAGIAAEAPTPAYAGAAGAPEAIPERYAAQYAKEAMAEISPFRETEELLTKTPGAPPEPGERPVKLGGNTVYIPPSDEKRSMAA
jgi:hypothetical protein